MEVRGKNLKVVGGKVPEEIYYTILVLASGRGQTLSQAVREAMTDWIEKVRNGVDSDDK